MAGFLDKNTQVVDMILTMEGKRLLSRGELQFVYFALFDDEIDYDPYISQSGSMTAAQLSGTKNDLIEIQPIREAVSGYRSGMNMSGSDFTNVHRPLFTMKQGAQYLPRLSASDAPLIPATMEVKQQKHQVLYTKTDQYGNVVQQQGPIDMGYDRFDSQDVNFRMELLPLEVSPDKQNQEGVLVRIFKTGSEGIVEVKDRRDTNNDMAFSNDLILYVGNRPKVKTRGGK
ncbi:MAG: hypothetical protein JO270_20865 [Acidobacteriaceae bacterium]|nr:hypothetical protein [Acidobacteriaceae bacterium]